MLRYGPATLVQDAGCRMTFYDPRWWHSYYLSGPYFASDTVLRAYINSFFSSAQKDSEVGTIIPI